MAEAPGILAWIVWGAVDYTSAGSLHPFPASVVRETAAYRAEEDPLGGFVLDCLSPAQDDAVLLIAQLHGAYMEWADGAGIAKAQRLDSRRFGRTFASAHGRLGWPVEKTTSRGRTAYRGLRLRLPGEAAGDGDDSPDGDGGSDDGFAAGSPSHEGPVSKGESDTKPTTSHPAPDADGQEPFDWDEYQAERATDDAEAFPL